MTENLTPRGDKMTSIRIRKDGDNTDEGKMNWNQNETYYGRNKNRRRSEDNTKVLR
jgi:hypothetical protein